MPIPDISGLTPAELIELIQAANAAYNATEQTRTDNAAALRAGLQVEITDALARQVTLDTVLNATNAEINVSPAAHIKTIARQEKRTQNAIIRLARLVGGLTDSTDTGSTV